MDVSESRLSSVAEYSLLVGSGAGAIASIAAQNVFYASAPLTLLAAVGLLNRRRLERQLQTAEAKLTQRSNHLAKRIHYLGKQVSALPSPEALTNFQRSVVNRTDRAFIRFSKELSGMQRQIDRRFESLQIPDLEPLQKDVAQLQQQSRSTTASLNTLGEHVHRLSSQPRLEVAEAQISQLRTEFMQMRVTLETLSNETRTTSAQMQDSIHHFERQLRQLPSVLDPRMLKEEVQQLMRAVADLVPRRDLNNLVNRLQELHQRQMSLQQAMNGLKAASQSNALSLAAATPNLREDWERLEVLLTPSADPATLPAQQAQSLMLHTLQQFRQQIAALDSVVQTLSQQQQQLTWRLEASTQTQAMTRSLDPQQLDRLSPEQLTALQPEAFPGSDSLKTDWIVDFPAGPDRSGPTASRQALEQALDQTQERCLLVWPWAANCALDEALVSRFQQILERGCQLEIGWRHRGDASQGQLLRGINQRWSTDSTHLHVLKAALNKLLPLQQKYPDRFRFKILGTDEAFLVCDRAQAILSLQNLNVQNTVYPKLELKLRVHDTAVIEALAHRFEEPDLAPEDVTAYFNRGTTRYDLRDHPGAISDFTEVLRLDPGHAVALNNRGVAYVDLGRHADAEADFTQAIALDPKLFSAYCNRGWLRLDQNRYPSAIEDFSRAIELQPRSPIAYVYRGSALQKLGDIPGAIADYNRAVACEHPGATPYFYRSSAHQQSGETQRAIADLELARQHLQSGNDQYTLATVERTLKRLRQKVAVVRG